MPVENRYGVVVDIDHFAVHDGPGIRTSIYLKGCPLHCSWCHSPESQPHDPQLLYAASRCESCMRCVAACPLGLHREKDGKHVFSGAESCVLCRACVRICPTEALFVGGRRMSACEVADEALEDIDFYRNSGGGVTLSGGEVLYQADFALEILRLIKRKSVHTIVETAGCGDCGKLLDIAEYADLFYYDFKLADADALKKHTGASLQVIRGNLEALRAVTDQIVLRVPLIPSITDTPENLGAVIETARRLKISTVHFLPYNRSAGAKYEWCGLQYPLGELPAEPEDHVLLAYGGGGIHVEIIH